MTGKVMNLRWTRARTSVGAECMAAVVDGQRIWTDRCHRRRRGKVTLTLQRWAVTGAGEETDALHFPRLARPLSGFFLLTVSVPTAFWFTLRWRRRGRQPCSLIPGGSPSPFNTVLRTHVVSPTLAYSSLSLAESSSSVAAYPRRISHHGTSA